MWSDIHVVEHTIEYYNKCFNNNSTNFFAKDFLSNFSQEEIDSVQEEFSPMMFEEALPEEQEAQPNQFRSWEEREKKILLEAKKRGLSWDEIADLLKTFGYLRTASACSSCFSKKLKGNSLKITENPRKTYSRWSDKEAKILKKGIAKGFSWDLIHAKLKKKGYEHSSEACRSYSSKHLGKRKRKNLNRVNFEKTQYGRNNDDKSFQDQNTCVQQPTELSTQIHPYNIDNKDTGNSLEFLQDPDQNLTNEVFNHEKAVGLKSLQLSLINCMDGKITSKKWNKRETEILERERGLGLEWKEVSESLQKEGYERTAKACKSYFLRICQNPTNKSLKEKKIIQKGWTDEEVKIVLDGKKQGLQWKEIQNNLRERGYLRTTPSCSCFFSRNKEK